MLIRKICNCKGKYRAIVKLFDKLMCENCGNEIDSFQYEKQVLQTEEQEDLDTEKKKGKKKHDKKDKLDIHITD